MSHNLNQQDVINLYNQIDALKEQIKALNGLLDIKNQTIKALEEQNRTTRGTQTTGYKTFYSHCPSCPGAVCIGH